MQLPFVLQSAETMKSAVAHLEPHMDKLEGESSSKGKFLIATVKGDVHDIGKNLVDIILTNNGYEVINLGIKQSCEAIVEAQREHQVDCIATSGLLVKSTAFMKDNLAAFNDAGIDVPVILGGAALTPRFVQKDCREVYDGKVVCGRDAAAGSALHGCLDGRQGQGRLSNVGDFLSGALEGVGLDDSEGGSAEPSDGTQKESADTVKESLPVSSERSELFRRRRRLSRFPRLAIDHRSRCRPRRPVRLSRSKCSVCRSVADPQNQGAKPRGGEAMLEAKAEPVLMQWMERCVNESLLTPRAVTATTPWVVMAMPCAFRSKRNEGTRSL